MAIKHITESKEITAENVYSTALTIQRGTFEFVLYGTWSATVVFEKKYQDDDNWYRAEKTFNANGVWIGENEVEECQVRFGVPTGLFGSGTVEGRITQTYEY